MPTDPRTLRVLEWVQRHTILRRDAEVAHWTENIVDGRWVGLVSDNEALEELLDVIDPKRHETPDDVCECGETRRDHIYHEGACRPGFECPCEEFRLR